MSYDETGRQTHFTAAQLSLLGTPDEIRPNMARFSPCGLHRYELTRELGGDRTLFTCGLNPSTATAATDDRTISKDMGFARRWGCGRIVKLNAYGYRARDPNDMKRARKSGVDVIGLGGGVYLSGFVDPGNDYYIRQAVELVRTIGGIFMVSWGAHIELERQRELAEIIGDVAMCLGTNDNGSPKHELYIPYETPLKPWVCP